MNTTLYKNTELFSVAAIKKPLSYSGVIGFRFPYTLKSTLKQPKSFLFLFGGRIFCFSNWQHHFFFRLCCIFHLNSLLYKNKLQH